MGDVNASEDVQTTTKAFDNPTDEITDLLLGDEKTDDSDDSDDEETLSDESTEEEEVDESSESESESEEPEDDDSTWGKALGVSEDQIAFDEEGNVTGINVKVNGKQSTVSMADLVKDYQGSKSYTDKSQNLAADRKTFEEAKQAVEQDYTSKLENVETITNYLSNKLTSEFDNINWEQLRVENPAEYAAARQDYAARAQELQQAQEAISQEKKQALTVQGEEAQKKQQVYMQEQYSKMIDNNPSWNDQAVLKQDMDNIKSFANTQYGFSDQDFSAVSDARIIELLKDAKAYREGVKTVATKRKKPVPKFQKSKGVNTRKVSKLDKLTKAAKKATGQNRRSIQTDAVTELLIGQT